MAEVAVLGLGPVGLASSWKLLRGGHIVHGFDVNRELLRKIQAGKFSRAAELSEYLMSALGRSFFVHEQLDTLPKAEAHVLCLGTPPSAEGFALAPLLDLLQALVASHATASTNAFYPQHFILRSTLMPGTMRTVVQPLLATLGAWHAEDEEHHETGLRETHLSFYPEFLRENFLCEDSLHPPLHVAAHSSARTHARFEKIFPGTVAMESFTEAECLKLLSNAFHALKVVFANEAGQICTQAGANAERVMRTFCDDGKLNLSGAYLQPGGPFSGACLPKDLLALERFMDQKKLPGILLRAVRESNENHLRSAHKK